MDAMLAQEMSVRSEMLADALVETIAELRLIDLDDMIAYIRAEQWANIADLVESSAELSLEDGTLIFACAGDYVLDWGDAARIVLDLEMQTRDLTVFFALALDEHETKVRIRSVLYAAQPADEVAATHLFAAALASARRRPSR